MIKFSKIIAAACLSACLLGACGSPQAILKPYTVVNTASDTNAAAMIQTDIFDTFAKDIGIVSIEDNESGRYSSNLQNVEASEAFLVGTTDKEVISAYDIYRQMPPASITKILNALVTLKNCDDLDEMVTLGDEIIMSVSDAQVCGYQIGDEVSIRTLLYSMLVYSGNDAANALAAAIGGDISTFCDMMNEEAHSLGATQTHFVTPNGLDDPEHLTTAYDLYLIFNECLKYDIFVDAMSMSYYTGYYYHDGYEVNQTWDSTNYYLLGNADPPEGIRVIGGKTGNTDTAGVCLIIYVEDKEGKGYISVLLGSPDKETLYESMTNLLSNIRK